MPSRIKFPIAAKFGVMLVVLVAALFAVGLSGVRGLTNLNDHVKGLYGDNIVTLQRTAGLAAEVNRAEKVALQVVVAADRREIARLEDELGRTIVPRVNSELTTLRAIHADDPRAELAKIDALKSRWEHFLTLLGGGALRDGASSAAATRHDEAVARTVRATLDPLAETTQKLTDVETSHSSIVAKESASSYKHSQTIVILIGTIAVLVGAAVMSLLIRAIVPRIRRYSDFATRVAAGETNGGVAIQGTDELSELGTALNAMVLKRISEQRLEGAQSEFAEVMQLTENEEEAHTLLKHQIERLIPGSDVVMLNRNNSADRLQATTPVPEGSQLVDTLGDAKPRSCLAVRFARTHEESPDKEPLIRCEVCGKTGAYTSCEPLLVGGEVIGSVLATHERALNDVEALTIKQSVTQAAPVLGNLRNLAIAEMRAATDALTGLPNNRNVADTVKRMVAHASRTVSPIAALALDLDHFKQINDTHGHGSGDEVLAAVGATLTGAIRESDFVGRAGGEEFLILLPDTGLEPALVAAETIRAAVEGVVMPTLSHPITASIGVAVVPDHAGDANTLLRYADRALYTAKKNGRNRVETFSREMLPQDTALRHAAGAKAGTNGASGARAKRNSRATRERSVR